MAKISDNLLAAAEALLELDRVGDAGRRRAISTAYYAAFRRLAVLCASTLSNTARADRSSYEIVHRAINHRDVLKVLNRADAEDLLGRPIGKLFADLLSAREWADYSSTSHIIPDKASRGQLMTRDEAAEFIDDARKIIAAIDALDGRDRRKLSILLTLPKR